MRDAVLDILRSSDLLTIRQVDVAAQMGYRSHRFFSELLNRQGATYRSLLTQARRERCEQFMGAPRPVVTREVGFADSRYFGQWYFRQYGRFWPREGRR